LWCDAKAAYKLGSLPDRLCPIAKTRTIMRLCTGALVVAAVFALTSAPADAQSRRDSQRQAAPPGSTVFVSRDESGRTRTRIIVQRRSYLDGGTEVMPGERKFSDYATPPYYSAIGNALGPGRNYDRQPLNPPWELGGWTRQW
jgi:hypothetical protein